MKLKNKELSYFDYYYDYYFIIINYYIISRFTLMLNAIYSNYMSLTNSIDLPERNSTSK